MPSNVPSNDNDTKTRGTKSRGTASPSATKSEPSAASPIEQAEALRSALRQALAQTNQLIVSLRRQRKQNRLMKSTLESLKDLQRVAG